MTSRNVFACAPRMRLDTYNSMHDANTWYVAIYIMLKQLKQVYNRSFERVIVCQSHIRRQRIPKSTASVEKEYLKLFVLELNPDCECGSVIQQKGFLLWRWKHWASQQNHLQYRLWGQWTCIRQAVSLVHVTFSYVLPWEMEKPTGPLDMFHQIVVQCCKDWTAAHHVNSLMNMWMECFGSFCYQQVKQLQLIPAG